MKLLAVADGPAVVACNTCRSPADAGRDPPDGRGGALLADALRRARAAEPAYAGIEVQEMSCLFACADACTVHLRAPGKVGYVLGRFTPDIGAARAILGFAALHAASEAGEVPFPQWPDGVKGHFITRTPPPGFVVG